MKNEVVEIPNELHFKINQIRTLIDREGVDAILLQRVSSFSWATCGADAHINTASSDGVAQLLITQKDKFVITNNIEASRLANEEGLGEQGWQFETSPWYENGNAANRLIQGMQVGTDGLSHSGKDLSREVSWLRAQLTDQEVSRFKKLASLCAESMQEAIDEVMPGMSEYKISGLLAHATEKRGVQAIVNLVAADKRIFEYRHPLPTDKELQRYAMLVLCGRKWGLVCSITRLVHFSRLPEEVYLKSLAVANIDAAMIAASKPGKTLAEVFKTAQHAYEINGFKDEWRHHHQGGLAGYEPREIMATEQTLEPVRTNQVYAWNPSVSGAKSEDTILVDASGSQVLTEIADWPVVDVQTDAGIVRRPLILEKNKYKENACLNMS